MIAWTTISNAQYTEIDSNGKRKKIGSEKKLNYYCLYINVCQTQNQKPICTLLAAIHGRK